MKGVIMNQTILYQMSEFYKVFGDLTRLKILRSLEKKKLCVSEIADQLQMTHSSISHQLKILRDQNFVRNEKIGKVVYYSLADDHIKIILKYGEEHIIEKRNTF